MIQRTPFRLRANARYVQPLIAFAVLAASCRWGLIRSPQLLAVGQLLGEHTFSIYNMLLTVAGLIMLRHAWATAQPYLAWRVLDLSIGTAVTSLGLKIINLPRPSGGPHGFPSGHALTAFAASWLLLETFPAVSPYAFAIAVAVGWSRVEIREHYTYQVVIGALLGMVVGYVVTHAPHDKGVFMPRLLRRKPVEKPSSAE